MPLATIPGGAARPEDADLPSALEDLLSWARRLSPPGDLSLAATALLARLARDGGSGVTALAAAEGVSQPAMSQMVARLERDGLVQRARHPDDGRALVVVLTDAGRDLVSRRRAERARALSTLVEQAPADDVATLLAAAPALGRLARAAIRRTDLSTTSRTTSRTTGRTAHP